MRNLIQRNDAVQVALLDHSVTVDAQNCLHERPRVYVLNVAIGVENDTAFYARIEDVVQLQLARQHVDHFGQRGVVQRETTVRSGRRGGRRRLGGRLRRGRWSWRLRRGSLLRRGHALRRRYVESGRDNRLLSRQQCCRKQKHGNLLAMADQAH